jgi:hypothetical protein
MAKFLILARDTGSGPNLSPDEIQSVMRRYFAWTDRQRSAGRLHDNN